MSVGNDRKVKIGRNEGGRRHVLELTVNGIEAERESESQGANGEWINEG